MNYLQSAAHRIRLALPPGTQLPPGSDTLFLFYAVLLRAKGGATTAADVHDAWSAWASLDDPDHDSIRPYEELSKAVRAEDLPFLEAILECARRDPESWNPSGPKRGV